MGNHHHHGSEHEHRPDTTGIHGMLVFGDDPIFMSHLPMFSMPEHCFQVLLRTGLAPQAEAAYRDSLREANGVLHTFEPRPFPLAELDPQADSNRDSMAGTLVRGHFERGGTALATEVQAQIDAVVAFRPLDPHAEHDTGRPLAYLCFGSPDRPWLAHRITARPDFDQVLHARLAPATGSAATADTVGPDTAALLLVDGREDSPDQRLRDHEQATGTLAVAPGTRRHHEFPVTVTTGAELYFEAGELE